MLCLVQGFRVTSLFLLIRSVSQAGLIGACEKPRRFDRVAVKARTGQSYQKDASKADINAM